MQELSVDGKFHCKSNLKVQEDAFIDGSLNVGRSRDLDLIWMFLTKGLFISKTSTAGGGDSIRRRSSAHALASIMENMTSLQTVSYELIGGLMKICLEF